MSLACENVKSYLEEKGVKYDYFEAGEKNDEAIKVTYGCDNADSVSVLVFFDESGDSVNVKSFSIAKVPGNKLMEMYTLINELNSEYRWVKFYVDNDNEITASGDAIIGDDTAGAECLEIILRYINIIDEVYPRFMKTIWS